MIQLHYTVTLDYQVFEPSADFVFLIHPARTAQQRVRDEQLTLLPADVPARLESAGGGQRCLRLTAPAGTLSLRYAATVELAQVTAEPGSLRETPVHELPLDVLPYLYPSRYCPSDRLGRFAWQQFARLPRGDVLVQGICDWVRNQLTFEPGASLPTTTALESLLARAGVCRDFAHVMIALCRAMNVPARFVSGTDYGADAALGPPDFHAYVEVYLSGRWYIFDPSGTALPTGLMRLATGRDAADAAFATIFGRAQGEAPRIAVQAVTAAGLQLPQPTSWHVSTA